jgi:hypothetical protein
MTSAAAMAGLGTSSDSSNVLPSSIYRYRASTSCSGALVLWLVWQQGGAASVLCL